MVIRRRVKPALHDRASRGTYTLILLAWFGDDEVPAIDLTTGGFDPRGRLIRAGRANWGDAGAVLIW